MKTLAPEEAEAFFKAHPATSGRPASPVRLALLKLEPGEAVLLERGADFERSRTPYWIMRDITRDYGRTFAYSMKNDYSQVLIQRKT